MKKYLTGTSLIVLAAVAVSASADAKGPFDKLKKRAKEAIEKTVDNAKQGREPAPPQAKKKESAGGAASQGQTGAEAIDPDAPAPYGRWQGRMDAKGQQSLVGYGSLDIVLSEEANVLRYANAANRCLGEMTGKDGQYEVTFVTGQSFCGSTAHIRMDANGRASVDWIDAPDTASNERKYSADLRHTVSAWAPKWSTGADERAKADVVGYTLGMTYEAALAHMEAEHGDLQNELRLILDAGSTSIVQHLQPKKMTASEVGQQIDLVFAAQTPEQMEVEQDPKVLARRAEIKKMQEERNAQIQEMRSQRYDRRAVAEGKVKIADPNDLPPLPEMPPLRKPGSDAELLAVHRKVAFSQNQRPHQQTLMDALVQKYGAPSVRIDQGPVRKLQWAFDADGNRIANASEGPCDHIWKAPGRIEGLVTWYGQKAVFATVSPQCGLTIKAEMRYDDRDQGVWQLQVTTYDQQRLLGDEWDKIRYFSAGYLAEEKAKQAKTKAVEAPEL